MTQITGIDSSSMVVSLSDGSLHRLLAFLVWVAPLLLGGCAAVASPQYKVLERRDWYEVRQYDGHLLAETEVRGAFIMPAEYTLPTLPRPKDPRVKIRETAVRKVAVLTYSGYATEKRVREKIDRMRSLLERDGYRPASTFQSAQYNPPWTLPFFRRNEIMVDL